MIIESWTPVEEKRKWKLVRRDSCTDVPGSIVSANEETGECCLEVATPGGTEAKTFSFGPDGIRLVGRR
jgi:hypothetical protein